jgi:hypothetical protein
MARYKDSYSLFYRIPVKETWKKVNKFEECIFRINGTFVDLENLNYVFHKLLGEFFDKPDSSTGKMILNALPTIAKDAYIHLDIIRKIIEDNIIKEVLKDTNFKKLYKKEENFWNLIRLARNNIIIHKEKKFYYKNMASITSTHPKHLMTFRLHLKSNPENIDYIELQPLTHIAKMEEILKEYEEFWKKNY